MSAQVTIKVEDVKDGQQILFLIEQKQATQAERDSIKAIIKVVGHFAVQSQGDQTEGMSTFMVTSPAMVKEFVQKHFQKT